MSPEFRLLQEAIEDGWNISATYKGHHRLMTPHTLGWKKNLEQCLLYQYDGSSSSQSVFRPNSPSNWRCVHVNQLRDVKLVKGDLRTCTRHTRRQTCVDDVLCELDLALASAKASERLEN